MNTVFTESQHFRRRWLFFVVVLANLVSAIPLVRPFIMDAPTNTMPNDSVSISLFFVLLGLVILLFLFRLDTQISAEGISARLFPIHRKFRQFSWGDIAHIEVRKYNPLMEYGGWGVRIGRNGKAWNIAGNQGIQIEFKNGKKLLIGTQKPDDVHAIIEQLQLK